MCLRVVSKKKKKKQELLVSGSQGKSIGVSHRVGNKSVKGEILSSVLFLYTMPLCGRLKALKWCQV